MELDKPEFVALINQEDTRLANKNTAIPGRPLQATMSIFQRYRSSGPLFQPFIENLAYPVNSENLSNHVHAWYQDRYGSKLNIDPSPGRFPVLIEGATYECRLPLIMGKFLIVGRKGKFKDKTILNAVEFIKELPKHVRERMSGPVENLLQAMFVTCLEAAKEIHQRKSALLRAAESDIIQSCDLLCGYHVNTSLSSWHSLQFAEKVLKEYISKAASPPHTHKISDLRDWAIREGYQPDPRIDWDVFRFNASVRYEPDMIGLDVAIRANYEAWRIGYNVLKQLET